MQHKWFLLLGIVCMLGKQAKAQNNTSPYSILGIGDIENGYYGRWSGMGNASTALSSNRYLNQANPASLSHLDNQYFAIEVAGRYKGVKYKQSQGVNSTDNNASDISFEKVALGVKLSPKWGSGIGIMPFSSSNYSFYSSKNVQGGNNEQQTVYNEGSGGINQVYWANSYEVLKNVSVGVQAAYLFGSLNQQETLISDLIGSTIVTNSNIYYKQARLNYGLQYQGNITKKWQLALGGTYANQTKLNGEYTLSVKQDATEVVPETVLKNQKFTLPQTFSAGIGLINNNNLTIGADYKYEDWSKQNYRGLSYSLVNSSKIAAGFEYSAKATAWNAKFEKFFYQGGFFYHKSYLRIANEQLNDYGVTAGFGVNTRRSPLGFHMALEVGKRGTTNKGLIQETYTQLTFTISYRDFWFTKGRKYD